MFVVCTFLCKPSAGQKLLFFFSSRCIVSNLARIVDSLGVNQPASTFLYATPVPTVREVSWQVCK